MGTGEIKQVKVLGVMALLDEEETDWKIIVIDVNDPLASKLNDIEDVERHLPGLVRASNEWFRIYKNSQLLPLTLASPNGSLSVVPPLRRGRRRATSTGAPSVGVRRMASRHLLLRRV